MAIIGKFTCKDDRYDGHIEPLTLSSPAYIDPVAKRGDKSPDYHILAHGAEIGVAWERATQDGQTFLSVVRQEIEKATLR